MIFYCQFKGLYLFWGVCNYRGAQRFRWGQSHHERERERERERDRQTDRQTEGERELEIKRHRNRDKQERQGQIYMFEEKYILSIF